MNKTNHFSWLILRIGKYILNHLCKNSKIILKGYISLKWACAFRSLGMWKIHILSFGKEKLKN